MKKYSILFFCIIGIVLSGFRSDDFDCESFFPTIEGTSLSYTYFDEKNKITGYAKQTVAEVNQYAAGIEVTMQLETRDKKNENPYAGEMTFRCEGDKYYVDMSNMLPPGTMDAYQGMDVEMETSFLEFPSNPVAGQSLPDGSLTMYIKSGGATLMTMTVNVTNRKVEGFESITTEAGTFDCVRYSETVTVKTLFTFTSNTKTWISKNVGMVRSEDYNDKGKLRSISLLTGVSN